MDRAMPKKPPTRTEVCKKNTGEKTIPSKNVDKHLDNGVEQSLEKIQMQQPKALERDDTIAQWVQDLEIIFRKAMDEDKLNIALKAKELLGKSKGWILGGAASTPRTIKTIDQWTLQEINDLIVQLDAYQDQNEPQENDSETSEKSEK